MAYLLADIVREIAGDVDSEVSTTLVNYFLCEAGNNVYAAAQKVALAMAARSAGAVDAKVGDVSVKTSGAQLTNFLAIAEAMRTQVILTTVSPDSAGFYAGGISVADKLAVEGDTDRVKPFFTRTGNLLVNATDSMTTIAEDTL